MTRVTDASGAMAGAWAARRAEDLHDAALTGRLLTGGLEEPFAYLGLHPAGNSAFLLRVFAPGAEGASVEDASGQQVELLRVHDDGLFAGVFPAPPSRDVAAWRGGDRWQFRDPYRFGPVLGAMDEHLFSEGTHWRLWDILGARTVEHEGTWGTAFAVWAPNASRVSVVGEFNGWDGRRHGMRRRGGTGIWEIFLPEIGDGTLYKYELADREGNLLPPKSDPVGFQGEMRPGNCSVVRSIAGRDWRDDGWMAERAARQRPDAPISIYEVHPGSWRTRDNRWLGYRQLAEELVPYVRDMGYTHIETLPITEHPFDGSWGYQPVGLFAPTSRYGTVEDFRAFVEACHAADIGLILDWVPAHFPTDAHGLGRFDGTALYEHADPREGFHQDWNTLIYNFGRREVENFLIANALYWLREHHVDALRVDAVASMLYRDYSRKDGEWVPNVHGGRENLEAIAFLKRLNQVLYGEDPSIMTIAEESTAWPGVSRPVHDGGLGFGFKWNMGWMHDTLEYMKVDPLYRSHHHGQMSFGIDYAFSENFVLPLSHDEVVHGKGSILDRMPGDEWTKFANLRAYYGFMYAHPGKKLLFMGQEFGQSGDWNHEAALPWERLGNPLNSGVQSMIRDLNRLYREKPALYSRDARAEGFEWIDGAAADASVYAWLRHGEGGCAPILAIFNFSGMEQSGWRIGVPEAGHWREIFNSDAGAYGGAGRGNLGGVEAEAIPHHGRSHSLSLTLPPLSALFFEPVRSG